MFNKRVHSNPDHVASTPCLTRSIHLSRDSCDLRVFDSSVRPSVRPFECYLSIWAHLNVGQRMLPVLAFAYWSQIGASSTTAPVLGRSSSKMIANALANATNHDAWQLLSLPLPRGQLVASYAYITRREHSHWLLATRQTDRWIDRWISDITKVITKSSGKSSISRGSCNNKNNVVLFLHRGRPLVGRRVAGSST